MEGKVVHCKKEDFDVYIGRPSIWGNPFSHKSGTLAKYRTKTVAESVKKYEEYLQNSPDLLNKIGELKGKVLGCWCKPGPCHGDILRRYANE